MYELEVIVLACVLSGLLGLAVGVALHKSTSKAEEQTRKLSKALADAEASKAEYQQQVAQHFTATAHMLNDLTEKYRDVHHHLAAGADTLCRDDQGHSLLADASLGSDTTSLGSQAQAGQLEELAPAGAPQPPLDYAPKTDADSNGTLSEDYGLEKVNLHADTHAASDAHPANAENDDLVNLDPTQPLKHSV